MAPSDVRLEVAPYDFAAAERLRAEFGISHVTAQVLVRRGFAEPARAREFLDAAVRHPLDAFGGLREGAARILGHVERGSRITVHGDYDVDGVSATAVFVRALRTLGGDVDWYLPSRIDDGYGLALATVERLAARGTGLLVTVDCAITAVDEVAAARAAGLDVVVTDHHSPRADGRLPDAPIVHPAVGGYPCPELCAAGVAHLLARALLEAAGMDPSEADADLDLVALATVADCVPLVGENRRLVRQGLRVLASTRKPGLQALMAIARVDPSGIDAGAIGFRLAPRINAAGRLHRADAGLELLLTADAQRARAVAAELDAVNAERRDVETRILFEAEKQVAATPPGAPAFVLAADGWHPGVVGIVASRIAERHHRPAVLIALDGEEGTGSGRSIPAFDLLGGLQAASADLLRHGGHRAAAGLTIARGRVEAFREAFVAHAAATLSPADLVPVQRVDAVVPGDALHIGLAEELERLAPFGMGNPEPALLVPSALLDDPRPMGEGRHVSFSLSAGGARSRCVAFGRGSTLPAAKGEPVDAAVRLELNRYNGAVEPRLVLRHAQPARPAPIEVVGEPDFEAALLAELERDLSPPSPAGAADFGLGAFDDGVGRPAAGAARLDARGFGDGIGRRDARHDLGGFDERVGVPSATTARQDARDSNATTGPSATAARQDARDSDRTSGPSATAARQDARDSDGTTGPSATTARQDARDSDATTGPSAAAARQDARDSDGSTGPSARRVVLDARGGGIAGLLGDLVAGGAPVLAVAAHARQRAAALRDRVGGFAVTTWAALEQDPSLAACYAHVVAVDPPAHAHLRALAERLPGEGWTHLAWGGAELELARRVLAWELDLRAPLADSYRALRAAAKTGAADAGGAVTGEALAAILRGGGAQPRSGTVAGRLLRVLSELGLVELTTAPLDVTVPPTTTRTELERSPAFRAYAERHRDGLAFLAEPARPAEAGSSARAAEAISSNRGAGAASAEEVPAAAA